MPDVDDATRQERRKKAGDFLKMADKLFKGGDLEGAMRLVNSAMETDPQNPYAVAYRERILFALEQAGKKGKEPSVPPLQKPAPTASQTRSAEELRLEQAEAQRRALEEEARQNAIAEAKRKAELEARRKEEEAARQHAEADVRRKLEEAQRKLEE